MYWRNFEHAGLVYQLDHLHPRWMTFTQSAKGSLPQKTYEVRVSFGLHCFTSGFKGGSKTHNLAYSDSRETRLFDHRRYLLSLDLAGIIASLPASKCFHTGHGEFFVVKRVNSATGAEEEYEVYFDVSRSKDRPGALNLVVRSAFVRDQFHNSRPRPKPVGFFVVLNNRLNNKAIKPAP